MKLSKGITMAALAITLFFLTGKIAFAEEVNTQLGQELYSSTLPRFDVGANEEITTAGIRQVGEEYVNNLYYYNIKANQTFSITWDPNNRYSPASFEVGIVDENGNKITFPERIGQDGNKTVTITVPADGKYRFYCCGYVANLSESEQTVYFEYKLKFY